MREKQFYDGTKLLSLKDISGLQPEIYMCVGNRTAGKSYFFKRLLVRKFMSRGEKFALLVRFSYELDGIADNFFKDLSQIDFRGYSMESKPVAKGLFQELFIMSGTGKDAKRQHCGYAIALNSADALKKYSSRFVDVDNMFFDEFMSETGKYTPDELTKFQSVHVSIARGGGEHTRRVPVFMCSNSVTVLCPYYTVFGIHKRLTPETKYLRGDGWVLEQCYVETAARSIQSSGFGRAFADSDYMTYATDNKYLLDNDSFIEKVDGAGYLLCCLTANGKTVGVWEHDKKGLLYVNTKYDPSFPLNIVYQTEEHKPNLIMVRRSSRIAKYMKDMYEVGCVRFEDLECKNMVLDFLGYSVL